MAAKVIMALAAVGAPIGGAFAWLNRRFDKKADKHTVNNQLQEIKGEQGVQRGHIAKLFDKLSESEQRVSEQMRENEQRAQDRHERIMERINK